MGLRVLWTVLLLLVLLSGSRALPRDIKIGAIFHDSDEEYREAFLKALAVLDREQIAPTFKMIMIEKNVPSSTDSYMTGIAACDLIAEGVAAIFGPGSPHTRGIVSSTAAKFDIPHIEYVWRSIEESDTPPTTINIYPDSAKIAQAISDTLEGLRWAQFTVIYETNDGLARIQKALARHGPSSNPVTVRQLKYWESATHKGPDYRPLLKEIANSTDYNIILDVEPKNLIEILTQGKTVKLLNDYYRYFITSLHSAEADIMRVLNGSATNISIFHILRDESYNLKSVESACMFDAVFLFNQALEALNLRNENNESPVLIDPKPLSCGKPRKYPAGLNITSIMRYIAKEGRVTGPMIFNETGGRGFTLTVKETNGDKLNVTASWDNGDLTIATTEQQRNAGIFKSFADREFVVTTKVGEPYVIELPEGSTEGIEINGKRYDGYCIELIKEIASELKMKYRFEIVADGQYGTFNPETKQWNGLIRRLLDHEADFAICDLTITKARESAVDFTMPFMTLGISILFAKAEEKQPELWSFLLPFSTDVWMYMATAFVAVSIMLFMLARMAPGEWVSSHPCATEPEELENSFNLMNSFWLTIGSLMQQGSDILPRAPSIRMVVGMWWFFTLIMVSSYTANLAAFLASTKQGVSIANIDQLAEQTTIKYGAVKGGATAGYFAGSNVTKFQKMWTTMAEARPSVLMPSNDKGVERVLNSQRTYAFFMESTTIDYVRETNCDLIQVGSLLDNKGYGIATPPNSPYRTQISETILKLQERGFLRDLKTKWWTRNSRNCSTGESGVAGEGELGMANVGGVFLVLLFGVIGSIIMGIVEFIWNVKKVAVEEKITPREALVAELRFLMKFWIKTKPVKVSKSIQSSSSGEGGFGRGTSAPRSIIGSFARLNILEKMDKDEPQNKSNNRKHS